MKFLLLGEKENYSTVIGLRDKRFVQAVDLTPSTVGAKKRTGESAVENAGASERKQCMMVLGCITGAGGIRNPCR